ncbi:hypothetical protein [Streptomyces sp. CB03234]|uniref:hypothetical protein n=1 Tax=Streptomyces sp. (strain CB03234) TaxID=1703937 RepID=UPI001F528178|nr:hypothetical protein [Streptomyces sp. CB03234]
MPLRYDEGVAVRGGPQGQEGEGRGVLVDDPRRGPVVAKAAPSSAAAEPADLVPQ